MEIIRVASTSRSTAVAGAIAGVMREQDHVNVQAIGAGAVNQAVKAVAIARGYLELDGIDIICLPSFVEVMIEGQERTAVRLGVERRSRGPTPEPEPEPEPAPEAEPGPEPEAAPPPEAEPGAEPQPAPPPQPEPSGPVSL